MATTGRAHALATGQTTSLTKKNVNRMQCKKRDRSWAMSLKKEENGRSTESFFGRESVLATVRDRKLFFRSVIASWKWLLKGGGMACFSRVLALPALVCV